MTLGEKIQKYREDRKMSQKDLAMDLNTTTAMVAEWEADETLPSAVDIANLSVTFGVTTDNLLIEKSASHVTEHLAQSDICHNNVPTTVRTPRRILTIVVSSMLVVIILCFASLNVLQYFKNNELKENIVQLQKQINDLKQDETDRVNQNNVNTAEDQSYIKYLKDYDEIISVSSLDDLKRNPTKYCNKTIKLRTYASSFMEPTDHVYYVSNYSNASGDLDSDMRSITNVDFEDATHMHLDISKSRYEEQVKTGDEIEIVGEFIYTIKGNMSQGPLDYVLNHNEGFLIVDILYKAK